MIIDTSAIVAILLTEPDASRFEIAIETALYNSMSAATYVELVTVIDRKVGPAALAVLDELLAAAEIEIVPFTAAQARWARHARLTCGAGRHPAHLNLGDCFAYAVAKETGEPLLYKGDDFRHTDVVAAV